MSQGILAGEDGIACLESDLPGSLDLSFPLFTFWWT